MPKSGVVRSYGSSIFGILFVGYCVWTPGFALAQQALTKQVLYHMNHTSSPLFLFLGTFILISNVAAITYVPTISIWVLLSPRSLSTFVPVCFWKGISVLFWFSFPIWLRMVKISCIYGPFVLLLRTDQFIYSFTNWIVCSLDVFQIWSHTDFYDWPQASNIFLLSPPKYLGPEMCETIVDWFLKYSLSNKSLWWSETTNLLSLPPE
jgi:hypothetical protein